MERRSFSGLIAAPKSLGATATESSHATTRPDSRQSRPWVWRTLLRRHLPALLLLSSPYLLLFPSLIPHLGLYFDDYWHRQMALHPNLSLLHGWPADYRPLQLLPWIVLRGTVGATLAPYYALLACGLYATALCLYLLVYRLSGERVLAAGAALLWACYPADTTVFWLDTYAYRSGALFALLALLTLLWPGRASGWRSAGVLACVVASLASNELYIGLLVALIPLALCRRTAGSVRLRAIHAISLSGLLVLYVCYRFWIGPHVLRWADYKSGDLALSPVHSVMTLASGLRTLLLDAWAEAVALDSGTPFGQEQTSALGPLAGRATLLLCVVVTALSLYRYWRGGIATRSSLRSGLFILACAAACLCAGLLPLMVTTDGATLDVVGSRVNAAAMLGAAPLLAAVLWLAVHLIPSRKAARYVLFIVLLAPLCVVGERRLSLAGVDYVSSYAAQTRVIGALEARLAAARGPRALIAVVDYPQALAPSAIDRAVAQETLDDLPVDLTLESGAIARPNMTVACPGPDPVGLRIVLRGDRAWLSMPAAWRPGSFPVVVAVADGRVILARDGQALMPTHCAVLFSNHTSQAARASRNALSLVVCQGMHNGRNVHGCTSGAFVGVGHP